MHAPDRATTPLIRTRRGTRFQPKTWDEALSSLARQIGAITATHGPDALGFYISGQLLTEDYYVANKLVKGFLGTNNLDSNSRLCMSSAVAGYTGAFGSDGPPAAYADIELADCFLLLGTNTAACHPIVWSRIRDRRREGAYVICADPRPTQTALAADLHLPVRPGTDLVLLNAMLSVLVAEGLCDQQFIARHTTGFEEVVEVARAWPPDRDAKTTGVPAGDIVDAAHRFATAGRALVLWSMGANQSTVGTLKNRALINLCLATGNLGRPGCGPLSLTGQPNAMGGRETGGLAHLLPGYRHIASAQHRSEMAVHWGTDRISSNPGLPAVELFEAAARGEVKALWIAATNPLVSMPDTDLVRTALERAELVVVQDAHHPTETSALAHAVLPAAAWPEKQGTMTNSERRVGLIQKAIDAPGEARPDWRIFAGLAQALGHESQFAWSSEAEVFDEFARCTAGRPCDISELSHARLKREGGAQWGGARLYEDRRVPTPDGRARFAPTPHSPPDESPDDEYPLLLTTGRVADQWHTMTRTGKSPTLRKSAGEPVIELHPNDATAAGVDDGELALVSSRRGEVKLRARLTTDIAPGAAFAAFHWGALHAPAGAGALNATTNRATDPTSKQPELKALAIRIARASERPVRRRGRRKRLLVIGTGMAGVAVVEEAIRRRTELEVTMLGEEPELPYNRILVSKLLARTCGRRELELRPRGWYAAHDIDLRTSTTAVQIDSDNRRVTDSAGRIHHYDALALATGSTPLIPPIPGACALHVHSFRTPTDVDALSSHAREAVVIGGGLLGLEAAAGLLGRGTRTTVVEFADRLMPQQLDPGAGTMLKRTLATLGLKTRLNRKVTAIEHDRIARRRRAARGGPGRGRGGRPAEHDARERGRDRVQQGNPRRRPAPHERAGRVRGRRVRRAPRHGVRPVGAAGRAGSDRGRGDCRRPRGVSRRHPRDHAQGRRRRRVRRRQRARDRRDRVLRYPERPLPQAHAGW